MSPTLPTLAQPVQDDPYLWLEALDSDRSMAWVRAENDKTLGVLEGDPNFDGFQRSALAIAEARDRIPSPSLLDGQVFNFWQDANHVRGLWRRTTPQDYATSAPQWTAVLDLDELARTEDANWVWHGVSGLPPQRRRCMVFLSDGGEDAVTAREFDAVAGRFIVGGFHLPRGKLDLAWEREDALLVAREWVPGELTESGYPFVVKRRVAGRRHRSVPRPTQ
jgi:prolyl oligopeptidase